MDPDSIMQFIILAILLLLSAFFSSAETALTTVNKHRMRGLAKEGNARAKRVLALTENPDKMLGAILIGNNIVNLSASSLTTTIAIRFAKSFGASTSTSTFVGIATGVLTFVILIIGEITPKNIATRKNESMSLIYSGPIWILSVILTPVIIVVNAISLGLCHLFGISTDSSHTMTEMELRTIVDVSEEDGVIEKEEKELINNIVDFGDSVAKDIMIPRIDMTFASVDMTYDEIVQIFMEEQYSKLPVYEDSKEKVIGILHLKDLFFYHEKTKHSHKIFNIYELIRKPFFTFEFQKTSVLMEEMRKKNITFAVVLDEYGSTAGLVSLEDLLEEIVGEIRDEYDADEVNAIRKVGENAYEVPGNTKLADLNDAIGTEIESENYDSIGGHMIELLDHIPEENEAVLEGNYLYSIKKMNRTRIDTVYIKIEDTKQ